MAITVFTPLQPTVTFTMTQLAREKSTLVITFTITDESGTALTFGNLITPTWSLTTADGKTVINIRSAVALTALYIVLSGSDLAMTDNNPRRKVTLEATYNSATYGNGLAIKEEYEFDIKDLAKVS